jgi:hypothetical protein
MSEHWSKYLTEKQSRGISKEFRKVLTHTERYSMSLIIAEM